MKKDDNVPLVFLLTYKQASALYALGMHGLDLDPTLFGKEAGNQLYLGCRSLLKTMDQVFPGTKESANEFLLNRPNPRREP